MKHLIIVFGLLSTAALLTQCTAPTGGGGNLPPATKDSPFVNSLGMKFVPVPGTKILMCTTETTVAQYQAAGLGYRAPQFSQGRNHPAVNVSWNDAKAWCAWLSKKEGKRYRLPTDAEWSAAVGTSTYPWGHQWPPPNNTGNYAGQELRSLDQPVRETYFWKGFTIIGNFDDRYVFTAPVSTYSANANGFFDLGGNVSEWTTSGKGRGGSWVIGGLRRETFETAFRQGAESGAYTHFWGFRCVLAP